MNRTSLNSLSIDRRQFLSLGICSTTALCFGCDRAESKNASESGGNYFAPQEARFYETLPDKRVQCNLCPKGCVIPIGKRGFCKARENREGILYSLVYGNVAAEHIDPIEKKPFFHVVPGSQAYSIATAGCNMWCKFCQNYELSQAKPEELRSVPMSPQTVAGRAKRSKAPFIAYTYNEPTVYNEFVYDCAKAGRDVGVRSIVISNGYINAEPLERLCEVLTAFKVDLKAFSKNFYRDITGGERDPVLETIKRLRKSNVWMELVHLTIPTLNDSEGDLKAMAEWLMGEVGPEVPVHFTRFHPIYRITNLPVTPVSTLERARNILMDRGMKFVYVGNVPQHSGESTYCPQCGKNIIERGYGYDIGEIKIKNGKCQFCNTPIPGIWA